MIKIRPELEQTLEKIAHQSDRTLHDLVNDVLAGYVAEVSDLESLGGESLEDANATQLEPVYVRRRDAERRQ
jgi:predicted transcriptional regulator